ncbi:hypothetical protein SAMN05216167_11567 [Spirosoma endophyticum]|uniref:Uncharacterized protein n=1 Tax=Spirosoma endophyticum TaxID=662367 RepID=A0A1I2BD46_9BACT|nr:hypothetical protein SAMN05216167_11567 [Spirosoma endophyticum]
MAASMRFFYPFVFDRSANLYALAADGRNDSVQVGAGLVMVSDSMYYVSRSVFLA